MNEPESLQNLPAQASSALDSASQRQEQAPEDIATLADSGPLVEPGAADPDATVLPYPIVAIGASAGGLEACRGLIGNLGPNTGMAYVILTHLAPDAKSHLIEIIGALTSIPVEAVESGVRPSPDHIYILPPNAFASVKEGRFVLEPRPAGVRVPMPIDYFFRSLAADQKSRAIGVILSGADHDGALGLRAIKAEGGIAIVQTPESSRHPGMPRASIAADHVDLVLPPEKIGAELTRLGAQFGRPDILRLEDEEVARLGAEEPVWTRLLSLLSTSSGIDFRQYKPATVQRRIARRMMLTRSPSLHDYVRFMQTHPLEARELTEEILIKVTHFFRDAEVFEAIKNEICPLLVEGRLDDQPVRVWVPGCSTGEEAYSIAICLLEHQAASRSEFAIQIFGTDASERMVQAARVGQYPEAIASDVSPERLRRYFTKTEKGYQIAKRVRDLCIFARQNVCSDPPFSRIDLISCRNLLIYFNQMLQKQIIPVFHYALRSNGYLLLGGSETLRDSADMFRMVDRRSKIYLKVPTAHATPIDFTHRAPSVLAQRRDPGAEYRGELGRRGFAACGRPHRSGPLRSGGSGHRRKPRNSPDAGPHRRISGVGARGAGIPAGPNAARVACD